MTAPTATPKEKFEKALNLMNTNRMDDALPLFKEISEEEPGNPWYRSYYGVCLGRLKRFAEAEKQCQAAIDLHLYKAQFYINLGEVYFRGGNRKHAHRMFNEAIKWEKEHPTAKKFLKQMGIRRPPVLSFLDRDHPLNVSLGKLRHKLNPPK